MLAATDATTRERLTAYHTTGWMSRAARVAERTAPTADAAFEPLWRDREYHPRALGRLPRLSNFVGTFQQAHAEWFAPRLCDEVDEMVAGSFADTNWKGYSFPNRTLSLGRLGTVSLPAFAPMDDVERYVEFWTDPPRYLDGEVDPATALRDRIRETPDGLDHHGVGYGSPPALFVGVALAPRANGSVLLLLYSLRQHVPAWSPFVDDRPIDLSLSTPLAHFARGDVIARAVERFDPDLAAVATADRGVSLSAPRPVQFAGDLAVCATDRRLSVADPPAPHLSNRPWSAAAAPIRRHPFVREALDRHADAIRRLPFLDGDEVTVDFTGTAAQNRGPLNCTPALAFAGVVYALMALLGADLPKNDGFYRPLETITPEGSMVDPGDDASVAAGAEVAVRAADLVLRALAPALPDETVAAGKGTICNVADGGRDPRGGRYVYYETVAGGYGARTEKDGMGAVQAHFQNTANSPIEELETEVPLYVRRYGPARDSGGAGRTRGGLGVRRDVEFYDHEASFSVLADRARSQPWGLFGGEPGAAARYRILPVDGDEPVALSSKETVRFDPGDTASVTTPGGGEYGDPTGRDPERVLADVRDEMSPAAAREAYGVVIVDGDLDREATRRLRAARRDDDGAERGRASESENENENEG